MNRVTKTKKIKLSERLKLLEEKFRYYESHNERLEQELKEHKNFLIERNNSEFSQFDARIKEMEKTIAQLEAFLGTGTLDDFTVRLSQVEEWLGDLRGLSDVESRIAAIERQINGEAVQVRF